MNIAMRAFGANPRDPDIAVYLAYLYLRTVPAQAETARQLAMHAITVSGSQRAARPDDWDTLAVANALECGGAAEDYQPRRQILGLGFESNQ